MKTIPTRPIAQYQRHFDALMQDWGEAGTISRVTPRADAVREIIRQTKEAPSGN
jgi:hypothetical protein